MAVAFTHVSWWLWGGKEHEPSSTVSATGSSLNSSMDFNIGLRESETLKFSSVKGVRMPPATRRKWNSREERRIDREYDLVLVPSDGGCLSGSESDDSDWSIGWMEPHASDFLSDDENESSFAVLVPCYGRGRKEMVDDSKNQVLSAIVDLKDGYSAGWNRNYIFKTEPVITADIRAAVFEEQEVHGTVDLFSAEQLMPK